MTRNYLWALGLALVCCSGTVASADENPRPDRQELLQRLQDRGIIARLEGRGVATEKLLELLANRGARGEQMRQRLKDRGIDPDELRSRIESHRNERSLTRPESHRGGNQKSRGAERSRNRRFDPTAQRTVARNRGVERSQRGRNQNAGIDRPQPRRPVASSNPGRTTAGSRASQNPSARRSRGRSRR